MVGISKRCCQQWSVTGQFESAQMIFFLSLKGCRVSLGSLTSRGIEHRANGSCVTTERAAANASRKMPQERAAKTQVSSVVASDKAASTVTCPPSSTRPHRGGAVPRGRVPPCEQLGAGVSELQVRAATLSGSLG